MIITYHDIAWSDCQNILSSFQRNMRIFCFPTYRVCGSILHIACFFLNWKNTRTSLHNSNPWVCSTSNGWVCSTQITWVFNSNRWACTTQIDEFVQIKSHGVCSTQIDEFVQLKFMNFYTQITWVCSTHIAWAWTYHNINKYHINNNEIISNLMDHLNNTQKQILTKWSSLRKRSVVTWLSINHDLHNQPPLLC